MIALTEGTIFAQRYRIVRLIGQGGMGAVFEVVHVETERRCALKVMQPNMVDNDSMRARFRQEAKVAALVNSEHIVDVYDAGIDEATRMPFLVMELLSGIELRQRLKDVGRFPPHDVVLYLHQTALALDKTHRSNIIHRDLKPENLFLTYRENGAPHIKILDFGVAKFVTEAGAQTSATRDVGTPLYMGPEQFTMGAQPSPQTDIYALGMMAFTLLTGGSYWLEDTRAPSTIYAFALLAVAGPTEPATARALRRGVNLPPAFDAWFACATAKDPKQRFPTALVATAELADALGVPRIGLEPSMSLSSSGMRANMGSYAFAPHATGVSGAPVGANTHEPSNATGAPLASTSGSSRESKSIILVAALVAVLGVGIGSIVILSGADSASPTKDESSAKAANPTTATAPVVTPAADPSAAIVTPTASASTSATTTSAKTASKSTSPAKPVVTSAPPKKDLFTRD